MTPPNPSLEDALANVKRFCDEWPKGSHRADELHGLNVGCEGEAVLRRSDLLTMIEALSRPVVFGMHATPFPEGKPPIWIGVDLGTKDFSAEHVVVVESHPPGVKDAYADGGRYRYEAEPVEVVIDKEKGVIARRVGKQNG